MRIRAASLAATIGATALLAGGCQPDTVEVSFRPARGDTYVYESAITSIVTTELAGDTPDEVRDDAVVRATQRVLQVDGEGVRVEVRLSRAGTGERTFVVRFDRAAQLVAVESVEGIPSAVLGELGLSEIFPAAAGAPPSRPLAPGDKWTIDDDVRLPGSEPTTLAGEGRLAELGVVDGRDVATLTSRSMLPLRSSTTDATGTRSLTGTQHSEVTAVYDLTDGSLQRASAVTTGRFALVIEPPPGQSGAPVTGTIVVEVRSETRRQA